MKRKNEDEEELDVSKAAKLDPPPEEAGKRSMQGQGDNKHSIDSDDEEDDREKFATFDKMAEDNELLEGQEDDTVTQDGEIKITPFNLKEEW